VLRGDTGQASIAVIAILSFCSLVFLTISVATSVS